MARIKVRLADGRTGSIEENEFDSSMTKLDTPVISTQAVPQEKSILEGNLAGKNLVSGKGFINNLLNAISKPATATAQTIGGGAIEGGRFLQSLLGDEKAYGYRDEKGNWVTPKNPFIDEKGLQEYSDNPLGKITDQAKQSASLAAFGINPVGAGLKQTIGRGATIGAAQALPEAKNAEDVLKGAAFGGVTSPLLSKLLGGGKTLQKGGEAIQEGIFKTKLPISATSAGAEDKLIKEATDIAKEYGFNLNKGSAKARSNSVTEIYNQIQNKVNKYISKSPTKMKAETILPQLQDMVSVNGVNFVPDDPSFTNQLVRELALIQKNTKDGIFDLKTLDKAKTELANRAGNAFKKVEGKLDSPLSIQESVRYDLWKALDEVITNSDKGLKKLKIQQSKMHQIAQGLEKSAEQKASFNPLGIPTGVNLNRPIQSAQSGVANTMNKVGSGVDAISKPAQNQVIQNILTRTPQSVGGQQTQIQIQEPSINIPTEQPIQPQEDNKVETIQKALALAMLQDMSTGGKNIGDLKTISEVITNLYGDEKLGAADQKRLTALNNAEQIYKQVEDLALTAPSGLGGFLGATGGGIPGIEGGAAEDLKRVTEGFAKAIAGAFAGEVGVATDTDIQRWLGLMPKPGDTLEERKRALARLKESIASGKSQFGGK